MKNYLETILHKNGPDTGARLGSVLAKDLGISPEAARKRISRYVKSPNITSLENLPLQRNTKFIYLVGQYGSSQYWRSLLSAVEDANTAYGRAIAALRQRQGIMPLDHFYISCGAPIKQKKHTSAEAILIRLESCQIIKKVDVDGIGPCVVLYGFMPQIQALIIKLKARLLAEQFLLKAIHNWARKLGLVSYNQFRMRSQGLDLPNISTTRWDLAGPSYLSGLASPANAGNIKPGFFSFDILLNSELTESGASPFLNKCAALRSLRNVGNAVHFFVAESYSKEAFNLLKHAGVVPATVESLFGKEVMEGLKLLIKAFSSVESQSVSLEKIERVFENLNRIDGVKGNLRGALFEFITAEIVRQTRLSDRVIINNIFSCDDGKQAESDVTIETRKQITFIECKGCSVGKTVDDAEVKKWIHTRVPKLKKYSTESKSWNNRDLVFEIWTTGSFTEKSIELLTHAAESTSKYKIIFKNFEEVLLEVKSSKDTELIRTFKAHFGNVK